MRNVKVQDNPKAQTLTLTISYAPKDLDVTPTAKGNLTFATSHGLQACGVTLRDGRPIRIGLNAVVAAE